MPVKVDQVKLKHKDKDEIKEDTSKEDKTVYIVWIIESIKKI